MIISASRRTDIPAFYPEWFIKRIENGFFYSINPVNTKMVKSYNLSPQEVDAIVFWSKNPEPLMRYLYLLDLKRYNYYFQFTVNDYPKIFEPNVPPIMQRIETFKRLSDRIGEKRVIWRYDPIIISSITSINYHLDKIYNISRRLFGFTDRLMISFVDFYGKVRHRLTKLGKAENVEFIDIIDEQYREDLLYLTRCIREISGEFDLGIFTCAEKYNFDEIGIKHGSCIDVELIKNLFDIKKIYLKDKKQRKECLCGESVDMGVYDTCKFQCSYCYANTSDKRIDNNIKNHNKDGSSLVEISKDSIIRIEEKDVKKKKQLSFL